VAHSAQYRSASRFVGPSRLNSIRMLGKAASVAKNSFRQKSSAAKSDFNSSIRCSMPPRGTR